MKRALTILAALILAGCGKDELTGAIYPTFPQGGPEQRTILRGLVVDENGECIPRATVQIQGQWGGEVLEQKVPCAIGNRGENVGFTVEDVLMNVELTIRTSAPGYADEELTVVPTESPVSEVTLMLTKHLELRRDK